MGLFNRFFGRSPSDAGQAMIDWLSDKSLDDRRFVVGILYGGPFSLKVWKWVLSRPDCDKGTAAMLLWEFGWPQGLVKGPDLFPVSDDTKRELIAFITDRWRSELFAPAVFAFDPRKNIKMYRKELRKKALQDQDPFGIPADAWQPLQGRPLQCSPATNYHAPGSDLGALLGPLRLADMAAINPAVWEPIRRRSPRS